jgi:hypothetical protein
MKASSLQQTGVELALEILEAVTRQSVLALHSNANAQN